MKGGAMIVSSSFTQQQGLSFQKSLMKLQIGLEDVFLDIAQMIENQPVVILIDRGLLDGSAYVTEAQWQALMDDLGFNKVMLTEMRYDAVIHMVTAADGVPQFYDGLTNEARYEKVEEAVEKDKKIRNAYMSHKRWVMIDNRYGNFQAKINAVKTTIQQILGHNTSSQFYKKFLLKKITNPQDFTAGLPIKMDKEDTYDESQLTETFIKYTTSEGDVQYASVEKKGWSYAFSYTLKYQISKQGQNIMKKKVITPAESIQLSQQKLDDYQPLECKRICTIHNGLYMIFDYFPAVSGQPLICII